MAITTDYEAVTNLVEPGEYECRIVEAFTNATTNGSLFFSVRLAIRDDVAQKHQGRLLFHQIWRKKEPTAEDMKTDGFSFKQLMALCRAAQLPNGKSYETLDDLGNDLAGRAVKVTVEHKFNEYRGETEARVKWVNKSEVAETAPTVPATPKGSVSDLAMEDEDDLPWG